MSESAMMMMIILASVLSVVAGMDPLSFVNVCRAKDPNLNECVKNTANMVIPLMSKGVPEYSVPPLDPMLTPKMEIVRNSNLASVKLTYTDVTQIGLSRMMVQSADVDLEKGLWVFNVSEPQFTMFGNYVAEGTILNKPLNGDGKFNSTFYDAKVDGVFQMERQERDGEEYFKIVKCTIFFHFGTAEIDYENLFHGDRKLGADTNHFMTEHSHEILNDLKPGFEKVYGEMFQGYLQGFFDCEPVSKIFPAD